MFIDSSQINTWQMYINPRLLAPRSGLLPSNSFYQVLFNLGGIGLLFTFSRMKYILVCVTTLCSFSMLACITLIYSCVCVCVCWPSIYIVIIPWSKENIWFFLPYPCCRVSIWQICEHLPNANNILTESNKQHNHYV